MGAQCMLYVSASLYFRIINDIKLLNPIFINFIENNVQTNWKEIFIKQWRKNVPSKTDKTITEAIFGNVKL